jgi:hypothetical protein
VAVNGAAPGGTIRAGDTIDYEITVTGCPRSDCTGDVFDDPQRLIFIQAVSIPTGSGTWDGRRFTVAGATFTPNGSVTFRLRFQVPTGRDCFERPTNQAKVAQIETSVLTLAVTCSEATATATPSATATAIPSL